MVSTLVLSMHQGDAIIKLIPFDNPAPSDGSTCYIISISNLLLVFLLFVTCLQVSIAVLSKELVTF